MRFRDNFTYTLAGQEDIEDIKIPSTIIQPFIVNGIKHGLLHKKEGKRNIEITFSQEGEVLKCVTVDNVALQVLFCEDPVGDCCYGK